jgi:RTA1 like protein
MSGIWQTVAYVFRSLSIQAPTVQGLHNPPFILILVAPLWTNAFCFLLLGRLVTAYSPGQKLGRIRGKWFAWIFVCMDIM